MKTAKKTLVLLGLLIACSGCLCSLYFVAYPIYKSGSQEYLYTLAKVHPRIRHSIEDDIASRAKELSDYWLAKVEKIDESMVPAVEWTVDTTSLQGTDSFYCLDQYSDDCRCLLLPSYQLPHDPELWAKSHYTNEYLYAPDKSPAPKYGMESDDTSIRIKTGKELDTWIYLASKEIQPIEYALDFDFIPHTAMQETLQIDFLCKSLATRFRFNLENNKTLKFDIVDYGYFTYWEDVTNWDKYKIDYQLPLHQQTHVRMCVQNNIYSIYFDGRLAMAIKLKDYQAEPAYWYFIFWNGTKEEKSMDIEIKNLKIMHPAR